MNPRRALVIAASCMALHVGLAPSAAADIPAPPTPINPPPVQPANIGDLQKKLIQYYDSGAYLANLQSATAPAIAWIAEEAPRVRRPAVVFDIDETALSNWEAIKADDFVPIIDGPCAALPDGPCGFVAWEQQSRSAVIPPTLDAFNAAKEHGAAIFFITGRDEAQRAATERNLNAVGYAGYTELIMEPDTAHFDSATEFKAPQREMIERQGYTVIANVGDQPSDLAGGFAEKTYLLPNPFYRTP
jgi:predicted secreted acid phosphatase